MPEPTPQPNPLEQVRRTSLQFPVVGIGASAGGLAALSRMFESLPNHTGLAFVIVLHLSSVERVSIQSIQNSRGQCNAL